MLSPRLGRPLSKGTQDLAAGRQSGAKEDNQVRLGGYGGIESLIKQMENHRKISPDDRVK
jgi:hypothetical protein